MELRTVLSKYIFLIELPIECELQKKYWTSLKHFFRKIKIEAQGSCLRAMT